MMGRLLVAGVGNIFYGDDGFGCEVARRMAAQRQPQGTNVEDFGIRGIHLAYEMLAGYDLVVLVDAVSRGGAPGTLYVIEPDLAAGAATADAHSMELGSVFAFMRSLGGTPPPTRIVGCEPANISEGIGLSDPVTRAVDEAIGVVNRIIAHELVEDTITC
jgi:hydrogenase maturation protease